VTYLLDQVTYLLDHVTYLLDLVLCLAEELLAGGQQHLLVLTLDLHLEAKRAANQETD
jgi:hypothetical protein